MSLFGKLVNSFLIESVALTKGSQRVMNDKNLVASLAETVRDDARTNPGVFPPNSSRIFARQSDQEVAHWFLESLDKIEKQGYEGTVYSRDGVNSDWITRRYIAGSHNWEDIIGVMNMNLRDWYLLKNRNELDPRHKDLPKFNSVRDVGFYINSHYEDKLKAIRDASRRANESKMAKAPKLIDNEDYRVYVTLNQSANRALGLGTQWCTANSESNYNWNNYSSGGMLFQLLPYDKSVQGEKKLISMDVKRAGTSAEPVKTNEKFQFDGGSICFNDNYDHRVSPPSKIQDRFPYLYTDLVSALKASKPQLEKMMAELKDDPSYQKDEFKIKQYNVDDEIKKLDNLKAFFTDKVRPKAKSIADKQDPRYKYSMHQPVDERKNMNISQLAQLMIEGAEFDDAEVGDLEGMPAAMGASAGGGVSGGGKYAPGTAPTMPESVEEITENDGHEQNLDAAQREMDSREAEGEDMSGYEIDQKTYEIKKKEPTMENIDKDVKAMMESLKKYDRLVESCAPVLASKVKEAAAEEEDADMVEEAREAKEDPEQVSESADTEVLDWMKRFSKLGNMKGYGR